MLKDKLIQKVVFNTCASRGEKAFARLDEACRHSKQEQEDILMRIVRDNENTEYGKKYHFDQIHSVEDYKRLVPFSTYDDYAIYIQRMLNDEKNLITTYPINHYAVSSGSAGNPKSVPISQETLDLYAEAANMDCAIGRACSPNGKLPVGRTIAMLEMEESYTKNGVSIGSISQTALLKVKNFFPSVFTSPTPVIIFQEPLDMRYLKTRYALEAKDAINISASFMNYVLDLMVYTEANWEMLVEDIRLGRINDSINAGVKTRPELEKNLKPNPKRADELQAIFEEGFDTPIMKRIWPNMTWIYAIGTAGFAIYTEKVRRYSGDVPVFYGVYAASEAMMAQSRHAEDEDFVLIPYGGYFEFIPLDAEDQETTLSADQLEVGKDYEIIVTNLSGFYRYKIKDVIRVTGFTDEAPRIKFVFRRNQLINLAAEKTNDEQMSWVIREFEKETGSKVMDYSVYPDTESKPPRYVVFMEADPIPDQSLDELSDLVHTKLSITNPDVDEVYQHGTIAKSRVLFVQPETYLLYRELMIRKGASANQLKPVRILDNPFRQKFFRLLEKKD